MSPIQRKNFDSMVEIAKYQEKKLEIKMEELRERRARDLKAFEKN